jgi:hypothetical protein
MLIEGVADDFADAGKDVALVEVTPVVVSGNAVLLKRLFTNLVDKIHFGILGVFYSGQ